MSTHKEPPEDTGQRYLQLNGGIYGRVDEAGGRKPQLAPFPLPVQQWKLSPAATEMARAASAMVLEFHFQQTRLNGTMNDRGSPGWREKFPQLETKAAGILNQGLKDPLQPYR